MKKETISELLERDLKKLVAELDLYKNEQDMWQVEGEISNSAGNLTLHLIGNLNHFIGEVLGKTGYIRQRDLEFSQKNLPREFLKSEVLKTIEVVKKAVADTPDEIWTGDFPIEKHGQIVSTEHILIHLFGHLNYHLGQVNYHRRLVQMS